METDRPSGDKPLLYLFLDGVTDPQNFGSILRSAMFLGADGIIVNKLDSCGLTPAVSKVSSGALEFLNLYQVKYTQKFLADLKLKHDFAVVSSKLGDEAINLEDLSFTPRKNILLVLGSEGAGVSRAVDNEATHHVCIPPRLDSSLVGKAPFDTIDSLNVGVSAALMIHTMRQK